MSCEKLETLPLFEHRPRPARWRCSIRTLIVTVYLAICLTVVLFFRPVYRYVGYYGGSGSIMAVGGREGLPTHFTLNSGNQIPGIALGVWKAQKGEVGRAVKAALEAGYRHIDGAWAYMNEAEVGQALKETSVPRSEIFITSKLYQTFHAPEDVEPALDQTLADLQTDYVDLYLIHWPIALNEDRSINKELTDNPYPTWKAMERLVEKGKVKNIGISNFNIRRIQNLTANPLKIKPAINQVELNFWNPQPELVKWAKENDILLEAYSPLGSSEQVRRSLAVPEVQEIAKILDITPAQVLISWQVQRGVVTLPKSVHPNRIEENLKIVRLPDPLFNQLEKAAASHKPQRVVNPSKSWGLDFDIFDDTPI